MIVPARLLPLLLCLSVLVPDAMAREWKSADGERTLTGEFVKRDEKTLTLLRPTGNEITFDLTRLHADDLRWLDANHPFVAAAAPRNALFDTLVFGENRDQVLTKLRASKALEMAVSEHLISRVGFNGSFRTKQKIGGQHALLYFNWCDKGTLIEISLQTPPVPGSQFDSVLKPCWASFRDLLTNLHGPPRREGDIPLPAEIPKDTMMASHVWDLNPEGSLLLGTANENGNYLVAARFSKEKH